MTERLRQIFKPQLEFEGLDATSKFVKFFCDLYRIEIFKDGLDLILSKVQEKDLRFEVKLVTGWDTNLGCYLTEQSKVFNKILGSFSSTTKKKIILRQFTHNVMAHEMAHAIDFESGVNLGLSSRDNLGEEFRKCIGLDMKGRNPDNIALKGEIKRLMVDALKSYPPNQFIAELFARYFELLSISRNVCNSGGFTTAQVMDFFQNTTKFIEQKLNPKIRLQIDSRIAAHTVEIAKQVKLEKSETKFQEKVDSFHQKASPSQGASSWSRNVKSNASWKAGWDKYQALGDDKK